MLTAASPLLPTSYDTWWTIACTVVAVLAVVALVTLARKSRRLTATQALGWTLLALFVPVIGPIAWLTIGRPNITDKPGDLT